MQDFTHYTPWHVQQVEALTPTQLRDLALSFYACWQANEEKLSYMQLSPEKLLSPREAAALHCKATMQTILRAASLPLPTFNS